MARQTGFVGIHMRPNFEDFQITNVGPNGLSYSIFVISIKTHFVEISNLLLPPNVSVCLMSLLPGLSFGPFYVHIVNSFVIVESIIPSLALFYDWHECHAVYVGLCRISLYSILP